MDASIQSEEFWSFMRALNLLATIVEEVMDWIGGCPCHSRWEKPGMDRFLRALWRKFTVRKLRLPELCAGDLLAFIRECYLVCAGLLARDYPLSLARVDRDLILNEFNNGEAHFLFMLNTKLGPYQEPLFLVAAGAHHEEHVRRFAFTEELVCG